VLIFAVAILADRLECVEDGIKFSKQTGGSGAGGRPVRSVLEDSPGREEADAEQRKAELRSVLAGGVAGLLPGAGNFLGLASLRIGNAVPAG